MEQHKVNFHGKGAEYFGIWIVNILLTVLTLGIYSAWAKVRTNRYFYGNTEIDGDRFDYLAKPLQILIGRIIAVALLGLWYVLSGVSPEISTVLLIVFALAFPMLMVNNLRFDMKMTQYRNVRFGFLGNYKDAYVAFLLKPVVAYVAFFAVIIGIVFLADVEPVSAVVIGFVSFLVFGPFLFAWVMTAFTSYIINNSCYGNTDFSSDLEVKPYFWISLKTMLLSFGIFLVAAVIIAIVAWVGGLVEGIAMLASGGDGVDYSASGFIAYLIGGYAIFFVLGFAVHAYYISQVRNYVFAQTQLGADIQLNSELKTLPYTWLVMSNLLLVIFTLGLARPWTAVRYARCMADATTLEGDLSLESTVDAGDSSSNAIADEVSQAFDLDIGVI